MSEREFRELLPLMIQRYDANRDATERGAEDEDGWEDFLVSCTSDQSRRALDVLELHIQNGAHHDE